MRFHNTTQNGSFFTKHLSSLGRPLTRLGAGLALALAIGTPLFAAGATAGPNVTAAPAAVESSVNWYAPDRVNTLLRDLREINSRLDRNGQTLDTFARSPHMSWQSHANYLTMMKEDINKSGQIIREMQNIQYGALPWQQKPSAASTPLGWSWRSTPKRPSPISTTINAGSLSPNTPNASPRFRIPRRSSGQP
jgi:hypothetical protein